MTVSKFATPGKKKYDPLRGIRWPTSWSYSRWNVFNKCRLRYMYQYLLKLPQPESAPMIRGQAIHEKGEAYLDGDIKNVPAAYKMFADEMRAIKKLGATSEGSFNFTKSWAPTEWDNWRLCWLRIKIDALVRQDDATTIIDFKTGRPYPESKVQSEIYAVGEFQTSPEVETIDAEFWYLDSGEVVDYHYDRSEFKPLKRTWATRGREMIAARQFPPTKKAYDCKYCPFRDDKKLATGDKGPCSEWKKAK